MELILTIVWLSLNATTGITEDAHVAPAKNEIVIGTIRKLKYEAIAFGSSLASIMNILDRYRKYCGTGGDIEVTERMRIMADWIPTESVLRFILFNVMAEEKMIVNSKMIKGGTSNINNLQISWLSKKRFVFKAKTADLKNVQNVSEAKKAISAWRLKKESGKQILNEAENDLAKQIRKTCPAEKEVTGTDYVILGYSATVTEPLCHKCGLPIERKVIDNELIAPDAIKEDGNYGKQGNFKILHISCFNSAKEESSNKDADEQILNIDEQKNDDEVLVENQEIVHDNEEVVVDGLDLAGIPSRAQQTQNEWKKMNPHKWQLGATVYYTKPAEINTKRKGPQKVQIVRLYWNEMNKLYKIKYICNGASKSDVKEECLAQIEENVSPSKKRHRQSEQ